jgi:flagellar M-ring protein FliF
MSKIRSTTAGDCPMIRNRLVVLLAGCAIAAGTGTTPGYATPGAGDAAALHQDRLDRSLQDILDTVVGPGRSTVTSNVVLDLGQVATTSTTYTPGATTVSSLLEKVGAGGGVTRYESSSETRVNALSELRETRLEAPGGIVSLKVAVVIDDTAAKGLDLGQVRELVGVAAGADTRRGDRVTVTALPMHTAPATRAENLPPPGAGQRTVSRAAMFAAASAVLVLGVVLAFRRRRESAEAGRREPLRAELEPIAATAHTTPIAVSHRDGGQQRVIASVAPDRAAAQLRGWLGRDG